MAVVHFGINPERSSRKTISKALTSRGLTYLRAAPAQLHIITIAFCIFPLWAAFISLLPPLVEAICDNTEVLAYQSAFSYTKPDDRFPFPCPPLSVQAKSQMSSEEEDWLTRHGFEEIQRSNRTYYLKREPTTQECAYLFDHDFPTTNWSPNSYVHLQAVDSFFMAVNILSRISQALRFCSHLDGEDFGPYDNVASDDEEADPKGKGKEKKSTKYKPKDSGLHAWFVSYKHLLGGMPSPLALVKAASTSRRIWFSSHDFLHQQLTSGLCFQYLSQLTAPDDTTVVDFLAKHALRLLAKETEDQCEMVEYLRGEWGVLKYTEVGSQLSHLVKCMEIAIESQGLPIFVFHAQHYEGTCIQNSAFSVYINGKLIDNVTGEEMNNVDKHDLSLHYTSLALIEKVDKRLVLKNGAGKEPITSMFQLFQNCLVVSLSLEQQNTVRRHASNLRFPVSQWRVNPSTLISLSRLASGLQEFDDETPISAEALFTTDRVRLALSCFGSFVPSVMVPSGTRIDLTGPPPQVQKATPKKERRPGMSASWVMSVRHVPIDTGVADWNEMVEQKAYLAKGRAENARMGMFTVSGSALPKVFAAFKESALKKGTGVGASVEVTPTGGKRKVEEEGEKRKRRRENRDL